MVEKIERIARVKIIDNDVGKRFDSGRQQKDDGKSNFAAELDRVMSKKSPPKATTSIPEAYKLELSNTSQSLFFFGATNMGALLN